MLTWDNLLTKSRFVHRITGTRSSLRPDEKGGGVLADDMGMGKSLSILALIIETVEEGREWAENRRSETHAHAEINEYTHSTLVIVPSACKAARMYQARMQT